MTAGSIWLGITVGSFNPGVAGSLDVGLSYGIAAAVGYLLLELWTRRGLVPLAALCAGLLARLVRARTFTDFGHIYALVVVGGALLQRSAVQGSLLGHGKTSQASATQQPYRLALPALSPQRRSEPSEQCSTCSQSRRAPVQCPAYQAS